MSRRCAVCSKALTWPALYFCSPGCSEAWVRQAREREPLLAAGSKPAREGEPQGTGSLTPPRSPGSRQGEGQGRGPRAKWPRKGRRPGGVRVEGGQC